MELSANLEAILRPFNLLLMVKHVRTTTSAENNRMELEYELKWEIMAYPGHLEDVEVMMVFSTKQRGDTNTQVGAHTTMIRGHETKAASLDETMQDQNTRVFLN